MIKEFKEFIAKGNALDLAVGVVIGSAFSAIVNSIVNDIIMPFVGVLVGGVDFSGLSFVFKDATIKYGMFIQNVINFLIIAFCMFIVVRTMNKINDRIKKEEEKIKAKFAKAEEKAKEEKKEDSEDIKLLKEINKNLKALKKSSK